MSADRGSVTASGALGNDGCGLGRLGRGKDRRRASDGAGLVPGNVFDGGTKNRRVVERHGRKAHRIGGCCRRGVPAGAESRFENGGLDAAGAEGVERHDRQDLEVGQFGAGLPGFPGRLEPQALVFGQAPAADEDALRRVDEVGRGVEPGLDPARLKQGCQKGGRGAFAVGAGNLDDAVRGAAEVQGLQGLLHASEAEVHVEKAEAVQIASKLGNRLEGNGHRGSLILEKA